MPSNNIHNFARIASNAFKAVEPLLKAVKPNPTFVRTSATNVGRISNVAMSALNVASAVVDVAQARVHGRSSAAQGGFGETGSSSFTTRSKAEPFNDGVYNFDRANLRFIGSRQAGSPVGRAASELYQAVATDLTATAIEARKFARKASDAFASADKQLLAGGKQGDAAAIFRALDNGANINHRSTKTGDTVAHRLLRDQCDPRLFVEVLERGRNAGTFADLTIRNKHGVMPLELLAKSRPHLEALVEYAQGSGFRPLDAKLLGSNRQTLLSIAEHAGNDDLMRALMGRGPLGYRSHVEVYNQDRRASRYYA